MKVQYFILFFVIVFSNRANAQIGDFVSGVVEDVTSGVDDVVGNIENAISDVGDSIRDWAENAFSDLGLSNTSVGFVLDLQRIWDQLHGNASQANNSLQAIQIMDIFNQLDLTEICDNCQEFVTEIREHRDNGIVHNIVKEALERICRSRMDSTFCSDYIKTFGDIILDSIVFEGVNNTVVCQKFAMCPYTYDRNALDAYVQDVLQGKPPPNVPAPTNRSTYSILHVSDIHIDFFYQEGTNADCGGFQCCRADSGPPTDPAKAAGYWGALGTCDIPVRTFEQFVEFVSSNFNVSMIIWTGDNIDHQVWDQFQFNQTYPTYNITQALIQAFPNVAVYPMFGNHEAYPSDQYDTVGTDSKWLTEELGEMWDIWLDDQALSSFRDRSYYSEVDTERNLKIISIDTQTCDTLNFYLIRDTSEDPLNQLEWLRNELLDAENNNQSVFIMGHIPPGYLNCEPEWSERYRALVDRFSNIIKAQFYGHTHNDQFQMVRGVSDDSPVGAVYIAPSLTTYISLNPSFRIFEIDTDTNQPINYYQYRLDLNKWNSNTTGPIEWDLAYNFLEEYNLQDMSFASFDTLADEIRNNPDVAQTYAFNFNSGGAPDVPPTQRETDYLYCLAKFPTPETVMQCLGLDPAKTNLLYFASSYVPGLLSSNSDSNQ